MIKSADAAFHSWPETTIGKTVVTYIQTIDKKIVLPKATFRNVLKYGWGIFGAEYKNVIMLARANQNQYFINRKKKKPDPANPIVNRNTWIDLLPTVQLIRGDGITECDVKNQ